MENRYAANDDPILDIRLAISETLRTYNITEIDHKLFTDTVIDELPDFFRQPLAPSGHSA